jgi:tetratricopeptide (TPR) repeat protein
MLIKRRLLKNSRDQEYEALIIRPGAAYILVSAIALACFAFGLMIAGLMNDSPTDATIVRTPTPTEDIYQKAILMMEQEQFESAIEHFSAVIVSDNAQLKINAVGRLALLYAEKIQNFGLAKHYAQMLIRLDPLNCNSDITAGHVYLLEGSLAEAERHLLTAAAQCPEDVDAFVHLVVLYEMKGDKSQRDNYFREANEITAESESKYAALRRLLERSDPASVPRKVEIK